MFSRRLQTRGGQGLLSFLTSELVLLCLVTIIVIPGEMTEPRHWGLN